MDNKRAPRNALKNPFTCTPGTRYATNINNKALITRINSPRVSMFIGSVRKISAGFMKTFINAITTAAINAVTKLEIVMPGTTQPTNMIPSARPNHFKNNAIIVELLFLRV